MRNLKPTLEWARKLAYCASINEYYQTVCPSKLRFVVYLGNQIHSIAEIPTSQVFIKSGFSAVVRNFITGKIDMQFNPSTAKFKMIASRTVIEPIYE